MDPSESPPDPPPPPTPFEREGARTRSRRHRALVLAGVLALGVVIAGAWLELRDGERVEQRAVTEVSTRDAALLQLLEDIERSEAVMLGYYEQLGADLADPTMTASEVFTAVATVASDAADGLRDARARIVPLSGDAVVDDVRAAYLPHLDSWVDYLDAVATDPSLELDRERAAPFTLLINTTAGAFLAATEVMIATVPSEDVIRLAEAILDAGFRGSDVDAEA